MEPASEARGPETLTHAAARDEAFYDHGARKRGEGPGEAETLAF